MRQIFVRLFGIARHGSRRIDLDIASRKILVDLEIVLTRKDDFAAKILLRTLMAYPMRFMSKAECLL